MKAWEQIPSSVVVPLMQLSSPIVEIVGAVLSSYHSYHFALEPFATSKLTAPQFTAFLFIFSATQTCQMTLAPLIGDLGMVATGTSYAAFAIGAPHPCLPHAMADYSRKGENYNPPTNPAVGWF